MLRKTAISFLIGLFLILIMCGNKSQLTQNQQLIYSLLPEKNEVAGMQLKEDPRFFQAENLWELINGAAEGYLVYGFQEMITSVFINESSQKEVVVEIYQMKNNVNGFGIYSSERYPDYTFLNIGAQGYGGNMVFNFWKDKYYVKLLGFDGTLEETNIMKDIAKIIDSKIQEEENIPEFIRRFPRTGLIQNSEKYISKDFLGHAFLKNSFIADYNIENTEVKFFFIDCADVQEAQTSYNRYKDFIGTTGKVDSKLSDLGDEGFVGKDSYYGTITVIRK
ncbi:hypothetical protein KAS50_01590, partial [bacterium]|nr:hypothetical protein [bacterium]